jgi:DNA-directed RNA polymerase subunit K/omega
MMVGPAMGKFEFVKLSALRAAQLMRGCAARVPERHKRTMTAQHEIAAGKVCGVPRERVRIVPAR